MIMFLLLIFIAVPLAAGIESWFIKKQNLWAVSALAGIALGGFLWNILLYWPFWQVVFIPLLILSVLMLVRMQVTGSEAIKKGLLTAAVTLVILLGVWQGLVNSVIVNKEVVTPVTVLNPQGSTGKALVVYYPGMSSFPTLISKAYAQGLVEAGWRVDLTTASTKTPTDLSSYDLLVLATPTYDWLPSRRIQDYIGSLGDLAGKPTVIIVSAAGYFDRAVPAMQQRVQEHHGKLIGSYSVSSIGGNQRFFATADAASAMHLAAREINLGAK